MKKLYKSIQRVFPCDFALVYKSFKMTPNVTFPRIQRNFSSIHSSYQDPKGTFPVSTSPYQDPEPQKKSRDSSVCRQSQSIWQSEEVPLLFKKSKNYKKLQERKFHKNKSKRNSVVPSAPWRPQDRKKNLLQDMTLPRSQKKRSWSSSCYRGKKEMSWLCIIASSRGKSQEEANPRVQLVSRKPLVCRCCRESMKINRNCSRTFSFNGFVR